KERDHDHPGERGEHRRVHRRIGVEKPEAHAAIAGQHEIEERREHGDRLAAAHREEADNPGLARLIGGNDGERDREPEPHANCLASYLAPARVSTASVQRSQRSACASCAPTSGNTRQQRSHLSPGADRTRTPTPGTSPSEKTSAGTSPSLSAAAEVMQSSGKSIPASGVPQSGAAKISTDA